MEVNCIWPSSPSLRIPWRRNNFRLKRSPTERYQCSKEGNSRHDITFRFATWRHNIQHDDTQQNDTQYNDTQHKGHICDTSILDCQHQQHSAKQGYAIKLSVIMLSHAIMLWVSLYKVSLYWVSLYRVSLYWVSLCPLLLCWVLWRLPVNRSSKPSQTKYKVH
jgi:hypothetical protein